MERKKNYSLLLTCCRQGKFPHLFGFDKDTPMYLARIPTSFKFDESLIISFNEHVIDGMLEYEMEEYFYTVKEQLVECVERGASSLVILSSTAWLSRLKESLDIPLPAKLDYSLYLPEHPVKDSATNYFFVHHEGNMEYYHYEAMLMTQLRLDATQSNKPHLN